MTILIFNTFYYPKHVGGAEKSVQFMAERFAKSGNRVFVVTSGAGNSVGHHNGVVIIRIKQKNIFSTYLDAEKPALVKIIWHLLDSCNPLYLFLISSLLKRINPDLVHTHNIQGFSPFIWAIVKKHRLPLVHTFRDYYMLCHRTTLYHKAHKCENLCWQCKLTHGIKRNFSGYPDAYVGVSNFILKKHAAYLPINTQQTRVIYNAVDMPPRVMAPERDGKELIFGFIGRISKAKGAEYLLEEMNEVDTNYRSDFKVVFAGTGDPERIRQLKNNSIGLKIEFSGFVAPAEFYQQIDVLIVPSLWDEPFGRIVIESLSHSVPVCIARSGGLKELHQPECTWSFSPAKGELSKLITHILMNRGEIRTKADLCRKHAGRFSPQFHDQDYLDTYNSVRTGAAYTLVT